MQLRKGYTNIKRFIKNKRIFEKAGLLVDSYFQDGFYFIVVLPH